MARIDLHRLLLTGVETEREGGKEGGRERERKRERKKGREGCVHKIRLRHGSGRKNGTISAFDTFMVVGRLRLVPTRAMFATTILPHAGAILPT